jgi:hypothetical protein
MLSVEHSLNLLILKGKCHSISRDVSQKSLACSKTWKDISRLKIPLSLLNRQRFPSGLHGEPTGSAVLIIGEIRRGYQSFRRKIGRVSRAIPSNDRRDSLLQQLQESCELRTKFWRRNFIKSCFKIVLTFQKSLGSSSGSSFPSLLSSSLSSSLTPMAMLSLGRRLLSQLE